jgi:hypothetical protein
VRDAAAAPEAAGRMRRAEIGWLRREDRVGPEAGSLVAAEAGGPRRAGGGMPRCG